MYVHQEQCNEGNGAKNALLYVIKLKQGAGQALSRGGGGVSNASGVLRRVGLTNVDDNFYDPYEGAKFT